MYNYDIMMTYIAAIPYKDTIHSIVRYCKQNNLKTHNFYKPHATIIASDVYFDVQKVCLPEHEFPIIGTNPKLVTFDTKDDGLCLVIKFDSSELYRMHTELQSGYGLLTDYEYCPHITLTKNMKDFVAERRIKIPLIFNKIVMHNK